MPPASSHSAPEAFPFLPCRTFPVLCLLLSLCQNASDGGWLLVDSKLWVNSLCLLSSGWAVHFHTSMNKVLCLVLGIEWWAQSLHSWSSLSKSNARRSGSQQIHRRRQAECGEYQEDNQESDVIAGNWMPKVVCLTQLEKTTPCRRNLSWGRKDEDEWHKEGAKIFPGRRNREEQAWRWGTTWQVLGQWGRDAVDRESIWNEVNTQHG